MIYLDPVHPLHNEGRIACVENDIATCTPPVEFKSGDHKIVYLRGILDISIFERGESRCDLEILHELDL